MKRRHLLIVGVLITANAGAQTAMTTARALAATCTSCHGNSTSGASDVPALAGVAKDDIVRMMREYRAGTRASTVMEQLAKGYTDSEIESIAAWFSAQRGAQ